MTRLMRSFLVVPACSFAGAFVLQTFFPGIGGEGTAWGLAPHLVAVAGRPDGWAHYTPIFVNYLAVVWGTLALLSERKARAARGGRTGGGGS